MCRMAATPVPAGACPQCGADVQPPAARCWLCGWSNAALTTGHAAASGSVLAASPREPAPFQFSISGLLIVTTVVAVGLGAFRVAPGLAVLLVIVFVVGVGPTIIRARVVRSRGSTSSDQQAGSQWIYAYVESFAITAAAITAGVIACGMVAFVALFVACAAMPGQSRGLETVALILLFASPVVGLIVTGIIYWAGWPRPPAHG
jgi:hypothetical protein